ncbi:MAG: hypothetical protein KDE27_31450 [Planctomycetes bacterium]|nr:hypothetical protein [Planctomycetota bacterium]
MPAKSKKKTASNAKSEATETAAAPPDPREALEPTPANLKATLAAFEKVLAELQPPPEPVQPGAPELDLVEAVLHIAFADGLPCGYGQEVRRRIAESFVDRNEFRVTEAYEVEELLSDLGIPDLFDRCLAVRDMIGQIYADQNGITLEFLREAGVGDRNMFFQRVPAMPPHVVGFLGNLLTFEEICFSEKSTLRAQQRIGIDPKNNAANDFFANVRALLKPFGYLPLAVGKDLAGGKPNLAHELSPACLLLRLGPAVKAKKRR